LPFYLHLMKHLAQRASPCPNPRQCDGDILHTVKGKPAAVVNRLRGKSQLAPKRGIARRWATCWPACTWPGATTTAASPTCAACPGGTTPCPWCCPTWTTEQAALISAELAYQNHVAASAAYAALPSGPVHADLFRDNVMFDGDRLTGFFDFYFAGCGQLAVRPGRVPERLVHRPAHRRHDAERAQAHAGCLRRVRPLSRPSAAAARHGCAPAPCASGCRACGTSTCRAKPAMLKPHDPTHFERVLRQRIAHPVQA
jgi:homoserine kinase type II